MQQKLVIGNLCNVRVNRREFWIVSSRELNENGWVRISKRITTILFAMSIALAAELLGAEAPASLRQTEVFVGGAGPTVATLICC